MTESERLEGEGMADVDMSNTGIWVRIGAIFAGLGSAGVYVVTNWTMVEPILASPATIVLAMFTVFGLGGLSVYWLVGRPLEKRLERAEQVIRRMRERERELETLVSDLRVEVAEFRTILKMSGLAPIGDLGVPDPQGRPPG